MTDTDLVTRLAREAGAQIERVGHGGAYAELVMRADAEGGPRHMETFRRFAALVAEECAKVAEQTYEGSHGTYSDEDGIISGYDYFGENSAAAIRAKFKA